MARKTVSKPMSWTRPRILTALSLPLLAGCARALTFVAESQGLGASDALLVVTCGGALIALFIAVVQVTCDGPEPAFLGPGYWPLAALVILLGAISAAPPNLYADPGTPPDPTWPYWLQIASS